jgi:hypothetical protein
MLIKKSDSISPGEKNKNGKSARLSKNPVTISYDFHATFPEYGSTLNNNRDNHA